MIIEWQPFAHLTIRLDAITLRKENCIPPNWRIDPERNTLGRRLHGTDVLRFLRDRFPGSDLSAVEHIVGFEQVKDEFRTSLFRKGPRDSRVGLTVSPSNQCSGGCAYCYAEPRFRDTKISTQISLETLEEVFDLAIRSSQNGTRCSVTLGGGGDVLESFDVYLRALELSDRKHAEHQVRVPVLVSTVDPAFLTDSMIDVLSQNQGWITLSVDGNPSSRYHRARPFSLSSMLDKHRHRCKWAASGVFTAKTAANLCENYEYLFDAGFDAIQMRPARMPIGNPLRLGPESFSLAAQQYRELLESMSHAGGLARLVRLTTSDYFGRYFYRYLSEITVAQRCTAGTRSVFIDTSGEAYPCPSTSLPQAALGAARNMASIDGRKKLETLHRRLSACDRCPILQVCGGPCAHESLLLGDGLDQIDAETCDFQRSLCELAVDVIRQGYRTDAERLSGILRSHIARTAPA